MNDLKFQEICEKWSDVCFNVTMMVNEKVDVVEYAEKYFAELMEMMNEWLYEEVEK